MLNRKIAAVLLAAVVLAATAVYAFLPTTMQTAKKVPAATDTTIVFTASSYHGLPGTFYAYTGDSSIFWLQMYPHDSADGVQIKFNSSTGPTPIPFPALYDTAHTALGGGGDGHAAGDDSIVYYVKIGATIASDSLIILPFGR